MRTNLKRPTAPLFRALAQAEQRRTDTYNLVVVIVALCVLFTTAACSSAPKAPQAKRLSAQQLEQVWIEESL